MRKLLILIAALLALSGGATLASPFDGKPTAPPSVEATETAGWVTRTLVSAQREASLRLTKAMGAIRDGDEPMALGLGLLLAFAYGCFHAAGPGHGKTVVVSYFLSHDARVRRGMLLGVRIAATHVASAVLLVLVLRLILGGRLATSVEDMRDVKLASYAAIILIGGFLLRDTIRRRALARAGIAVAHECCALPGHDHAHDHGHPHHDHDHHAPKPTLTSRLMPIVLGAVPCTGAILILLFSLANGMLLSGLAMVVMIGVGMAVTMAALGLAAILARDRMMRWAQADGRGRLSLALDFGGPAVIIASGLALAVATV